jgi:xanthine dehydrogenase accessory factor
MEAYLELHHPRPELVVVGAGHVARPLCTLGSLLGLRVSVLDDRPDFATRERFPEADEVADVDFADPFRDRPFHPWTHLVLVTRGHRYDYECLRKVLTGGDEPGFIGMIGSRRRVRATFQALLEEGVPRERLGRVHSPIGLDLGAETPEEIAVSVAAELVHHWRGGSGRPLREVASVLERFLPGPGEPARPEGGDA